MAFYSPNSPMFPLPKYSPLIMVYCNVIIIAVFVYSVVLSVAVYSDSTVVRGDEIAAVINQNKDTFSVAVSDAVVGKSPYTCR